MGNNFTDVHTILLVDDEEGIRSMLSEYLEFKGYRVHAKVNGKEALLFIDESTPDLLITDIDMPVMNGLDLIKAVREKDATIPTIAISGDPSHLIAAENLGAQESFVKPIDFTKFFLSIEAILS